MKMGRLLICMMIYTLHNCGGIFKYVFVFSFSFYALTVEKDQMPQVDKLPHCFLPLHFWTDKGKVSTTTTMHPMLARAGFLPQEILDGSGNGGGVLLAYMTKVSYTYFFTTLTIYVTCDLELLGCGSK